MTGDPAPLDATRDTLYDHHPSVVPSRGDEHGFEMWVGTRQELTRVKTTKIAGAT